MLPPGIKSLILDMDGVIWRENTPIGNLHRIFESIQKKGLKYAFATNNSVRTPMQYVQKLAEFGVDVKPWQVLTSSLAVAHILSDKFHPGEKVFAIGGEGVREALEEKGFILLPLERAGEASAVIIGIDPEINFKKIVEASLLVGKGVPFIATNPDKTFPTPRGLIPGTGAWVNVIITATGVQPIYAGKPSPFILNLALDRLGTKKEETLVVGDRLETDIAAGQTGGYPCGLVLSGISSREDAEAWKPRIDFIARDLLALIS
jgi:4-nitrophenyl phosphatase